MTIGQRIKKYRELNNLSQTELAKRMNITRQAVSKAELAEDSTISLDKIKKYASALNVSESQLLGYSAEMSSFVNTATPSQTDMINEYYRNKELEAITYAYANAHDFVKDAVCKLLDVDRSFFNIDKFKKGDK